MALKDLGVKEMPVRLWSREGGKGRGIRWGEQGNATSYDRIEGPWPTTLRGEKGSSGRVIPFPVEDLRAAKAQEASPDVKLSVAKAEKIPEGEKGLCFKNAANFASANDDFALVHGKVTNAEGKTFDHAWNEKANTVIDPTTGVQMDKDRWYALVNAKPEARYTDEHALINSIRSKTFGPWTRQEVGPRFTTRIDAKPEEGGYTRLARPSSPKRP